MSITFEHINTEVWNDVVGYEGLYQVSNCGRVKSLARYVDYGHQKAFRKERVLAKSIDKDGYELAGLSKLSKSKLAKVHRLVAQAFIPNTKDLPIVNHIDGVKNNNSVSNLEWVNNSENIQHAYDSGLAKANKGAECGAAKLSEQQVLEMRRLATQGIMHKDIATKFGISKRGIHNIISRKSWSHI